MATEKRDLKPIWLKALQEIFNEANSKGLKRVTITALDLEHKAKIRGVVPSTCNAMRSIKDGNDEIVYQSPSGKSTKFAIQYHLHILFSIPGDLLRVEAVKGFPVTFPPAQDRDPGETRLGALQGEEFKKFPVVFQGFAPFLVVV
jgi:hypothetical protein